MIDRARPEPAAAAATTATRSPTAARCTSRGATASACPCARSCLSGGEPPLRVYDTSGPLGDGRARGAARRCARSGSRRAATWRGRSGTYRPIAGDAAGGDAGGAASPHPARHRAASRRCTTRGAARSRRRWSSWRCARGWTAEFVRSRGRARARHHPRQHQPPRAGADDHRPRLQGEDQRQHREQRRPLVHRGRGGEAALGHAVGRGHGDGPVDGKEHPRDAGVDHPQLARPHRHRAHLPGAGEGGRRARGADVGDLPRHADRAGGAGRGLLHRARRRAAALRADDGQPA